MRYSPYEAQDYGLQHDKGTLLPFTSVSTEAEWNLIWLVVPQLDAYLDIQHSDFTTYRESLATFPFLTVVKARALLVDFPSLEVLGTATPAEAVEVLQPFQAEHEWLQGVEARAAMAQSLIDVKDATALCDSVIAVDFRARRRL